MSSTQIENVSELQVQLEQARINLKDLNHEIRKIVGRPLDANAIVRSDRKRNAEGRRFSESGPIKRRITETSKSVFSRLSGPLYDDESKPKLFSRVIKEQPSREDVVAAQGNDEVSKARNRRIFGSLLGTLQKFCQEESKLKSKVEKKAQIEKKLDEKQRREKELLRKEKQSLISERRKQQLEIRFMEIKMMKLKELEAWQVKQRPLGNFIRTKATPHLYFLPKDLTSKMEQQLKKSRDETDKLIAKRQKQVHKDIALLEAQFATEVKAMEKGSDLLTKEDMLLGFNFTHTPDTDVSLIEHNIEPIAFESDGEGARDDITGASAPKKVVNMLSSNSAPPHTSVTIKKERLDDEETPSSEG